VTPLLLVDALELAAKRADGDAAVAHGHHVITYGELEGLSSALAFALERRGVSPGSRVATLLDGEAAVVAFWAIAKAGAVGVAFDAEDVEELASSLREVAARALIVDAMLAPTFHHAVARAPHLGLVIVRGRDADVDAAGSAVYVSYETAVADEDPLSRPAAGRIDLDAVWLALDEEGARLSLSHRALLSRGESLVRGLGLERRDAVAGTAFAEVAVASVLAGACLRVSGEQPRDASADAGRSLWICEPDDEDAPPTGATAVLVYSPSACGPVALTSRANEPARVLPNVDVRVVDAKGTPVAPKVVGEIAVRSSGTVSPGYFRTGDSGMLDDSGALYVL
jgi:acyl-CoA synthetase (AMP-forming)/AMP-acid ligase II